MASVADFVPFVTAYTGELPEVYEQHFIRRAIQSFMEDTRIAREELYVELDCNEKDFILDLPNCRRIVKVEDLWEDPKDCDGLLDEQTWTLLTPQGMARGATVVFVATDMVHTELIRLVSTQIGLLF